MMNTAAAAVRNIAATESQRAGRGVTSTPVSIRPAANPDRFCIMASGVAPVARSDGSDTWICGRGQSLPGARHKSRIAVDWLPPNPDFVENWEDHGLAHRLFTAWRKRHFSSPAEEFAKAAAMAVGKKNVVNTLPESGSTDRIAPGAAPRLMVADTAVAIFIVDGEFFAIDDGCLRCGASLATGRLVGRSVKCACCGWTYEFATGSVDGVPKLRSDTYEVVTFGSRILVSGTPKPP